MHGNHSSCCLLLLNVRSLQHYEIIFTVLIVLVLGWILCRVIGKIRLVIAQLF